MPDDPLSVISITKKTRIKQKIRTGTDAERKQVVLDIGELGFTTDTNRLYVGGGPLSGGNLITSRIFKTNNILDLNNYEIGDFLSYSTEGLSSGLYVVIDDGGTKKQEFVYSQEEDSRIVGGVVTPQQKQKLLLSAYPIGSIIFRFDEKSDPNDEFDSLCEWELLSSGKYLMQSGNTLSAGLSGGSNSIILLSSEIPQFVSLDPGLRSYPNTPPVNTPIKLGCGFGWQYLIHGYTSSQTGMYNINWNPYLKLSSESNLEIFIDKYSIPSGGGVRVLKPDIDETGLQNLEEDYNELLDPALNPYQILSVLDSGSHPDPDSYTTWYNPSLSSFPTNFLSQNWQGSSWFNTTFPNFDFNLYYQYKFGYLSTTEYQDPIGHYHTIGTELSQQQPIQIQPKYSAIYMWKRIS